MVRALSISRHMWTVGSGPDLTDWTLRFGSLPIFIWTTSLRQLSTTCSTQCKKAGAGLHSMPCRITKVSNVSISSVFRGNCVWSIMPVAPFHDCHWSRECGSRDIQHRRHGCQSISRSQSFAIHNYCCTSGQAWTFKHDRRVKQETSPDHCSCNCNSSCKGRGCVGCHEKSEPSHLSSEAVAAKAALLPAMRRFVASTLKIFEIYIRRTSFTASRIWARELPCFYTALCIMSADSKTLKTVTTMRSTRRTWTCFTMWRNII